MLILLSALIYEEYWYSYDVLKHAGFSTHITHIYTYICVYVCMYILIAWCDTDTNFIKCREDYSVCQEYMYRCSYLEYMLKAEITLFQFANHLALAYYFKIPACYTSSIGLYKSSGAYKQVHKYVFSNCFPRL